MLPDFSELIKSMNKVVNELKTSQKIIQENTHAMQENTRTSKALLKALES